jgi:hypothetical protein
MKGKFRALLWPPSAASDANRQIILDREKIGSTQLWISAQEQVRGSLQKHADLTSVVEFADEIAQTQSKVWETLEAKAAAIVQVGGIATTIITLGTGIIDKSSSISPPWIGLTVVLYLLCIIHLLGAIYFAVRARKAIEVAVPTSEAFFFLIDNWPNSEVERESIVRKIAEVKWNEDILRIKTNYLAAAEDLLLRGLVLFAISAIFVLGTPLWKLLIQIFNRSRCSASTEVALRVIAHLVCYA